MKKFLSMETMIFLLLVAGVLGIQTAAITRPLGGHFGSYQQVMGGMAKNILRENFSQLLYPKTDILVGGERGLHLNQYPFPSLFAAFLTRTLGQSVEFWGRLQAILFNLASIFLAAAIAAKIFDTTTGRITAVLYGFSPFAMIYGQMFFSEPFSVFCMLFSLRMLLDRKEGSAPRSNIRVFSAAVIFSVAVTGRVHFILFLPLFCALAGERSCTGKPVFRWLLFAFGAVFLPTLWYGFTYFASKRSAHVLTNIFAQASARQMGDSGLIFSLDYYRRIFDVFAETMLTPLGFAGFIAGLIFLFEKESPARNFMSGGLALGGLTLILSPQKIMAHDFYLAGLFPFIVLTAAYGIAQTVKFLPPLHRPRLIPLFMVLYFGVSARYFLNPVFTVPPEVYRAKAAAARLREIAPPEKQVIVASLATAPMVYYADRPVWVMDFRQAGGELAYYLHDARFAGRPESDIREEEQAMQNTVEWLEYFRRKGASFFAAPYREELDAQADLLKYLREHYALASKETDPFYIFNLSAPPLSGSAAVSS